MVSPGEAEEGQLEAKAELRPVAEPTCSKSVKKQILKQIKKKPTGTQYGPEPLDLAEWMLLADLVVPVLPRAPTGTEYSYSSSLLE